MNDIRRSYNVEIRERREGRRNSRGWGERRRGRKMTPLALLEILKELGEKVQEMLGNS